MFHLRDGWFFERRADGSVRIIKQHEPKDGSPIIAEITVLPEEWASVVASMTAFGDERGMWRAICGAQRRGT